MKDLDYISKCGGAPSPPSAPPPPPPPPPPPTEKQEAEKKARGKAQSLTRRGTESPTLLNDELETLG
jgi:hypothetical protein